MKQKVLYSCTLGSYVLYLEPLEADRLLRLRRFLMMGDLERDRDLERERDRLYERFRRTGERDGRRTGERDGRRTGERDGRRTGERDGRLLRGGGLRRR